MIASVLVAILLAGCASDAAKTAVPVQMNTAQATAPTPPVAPVAKTPPLPTKTATVPTLQSAYFDYDQDAIKETSVAAVRTDAEYLLQSSARIELDGNADERGSRDYNMALGQKRADAVKRAMTALGIKAERIETISYGEDQPKAKGHDEAAWAENRRVDVVKK
jgi:peptidoglycan-associated lipoprotein